uniref:Uncharacterized protein n=1 Tax=Aegilops tauschii TaxID=37682 RepID=M8BZY0_AEGTA
MGQASGWVIGAVCVACVRVGAEEQVLVGIEIPESKGCSRTRGHGYYSSTWSCSCGLFISNNAIKPSEVPRRFPFAAPLFGCSRVPMGCPFVWMYLAVAFMAAAAACQLVLSQGQAPIHATT